MVDIQTRSITNNTTFMNTKTWALILGKEAQKDPFLPAIETLNIFKMCFPLTYTKTLSIPSFTRIRFFGKSF